MEATIRTILFTLLACLLAGPSSESPPVPQSSGTLANSTVPSKDNPAASRLQDDDPAARLTQLFSSPGDPSLSSGPVMVPPPGPGLWGPPRPLLRPPQACLEEINRQAAFAGYLKSKLQLHGDQKEAWRRIEDAAEPAVDALRAACTQMPDHLDAQPSALELIDAAERLMTARASFLRAVRDPVQHLYDLLSPDQRAALTPPPHPGPF